MKKFTAILLCLIIALSTVTVFAAEKIVIGATPLPHALVLEYVKEDFEALGYELEIQVATDYYLFNPATAAGDTDANYFQHFPFLNTYNADVPEAEQLVAAFGVHYEPMGLFPGKSKTLEEIQKGAIIAVPNDPSNLTRSLLLVEEAGWITLPEGSFEKGVTPAEIIDNPYEIEFWEMNSDLVPSSLEDANYAVINGNHAIAAGFTSANDALVTEPVEGEAAKIYTNAVVVRPADLEKQWVKDLQSVLLTEKVKEFMESEPSFGGAVKPTF